MMGFLSYSNKCPYKFCLLALYCAVPTWWINHLMEEGQSSIQEQEVGGTATWHRDPLMRTVTFGVFVVSMTENTCLKDFGLLSPSFKSQSHPKTIVPLARRGGIETCFLGTVTRPRTVLSSLSSSRQRCRLCVGDINNSVDRATGQPLGILPHQIRDSLSQITFIGYSSPSCTACSHTPPRCHWIGDEEEDDDCVEICMIFYLWF
ncbi:hypothetical protein VNO80_03854 [Phaseolus coccineus]|uniref:Uncharacterized protein n=1 Tax=Phaseolus coccineus TaxID=3886 RepID=A0AAN9NXN6_PHACN